jgi:hypothetical protein
MSLQFLSAQKNNAVYGSWVDRFGREYLVKINTKTGAFKKVARYGYKVGIAMGASAFDNTNQKYMVFMQSSRKADSSFLCIIDVKTGNITHIPYSDTSAMVPQLNQADGKLYGIATIGKTIYLSSVDPADGSIKRIAPLDFTSYVPLSTFDQQHGYLIIEGDDSKGINLYAYRVKDGKLAYKFPMDTLTNIISVNYNENNGKINALSWDAKSGTEYLLEIDTATGHFKTLNSIPGLKYLAYTNAYNSGTGRFTFDGQDSAGNFRLYTLDVSNAKVQYTPMESVNSEFIEMHYAQQDSVPNLFYAQGTIKDQYNQVVNNAYVYLYDKSGKLSDSTLTDNNGRYLFSVSPGDYYINVKPSLVSGQLSTYYGSTVSLHNARLLGVQDYTTADITLLGSDLTKSDGSISGTVYQSSDCSTEQGNTPATGVKVFLADNNGQPQYETVTDAYGRFVFDTLATLKYSVWVDEMNIDNSTAPDIDLSGSVKKAKDLVLNLCTDRLTLLTKTTALEESKAADNISVYPNPFTGSLNIRLKPNSSISSVTMLDVAGREIIKMACIALNNSQIQINTTGVKPGVYFIRIMSNGTMSETKLLKL